MNHNKFYTSSIQVLFKFYWSCYKNTTSSIEFCKNGWLFIQNSTQARCSCYDWRIWPPGALKVDGQTAKSLNWNPDFEWSWMRTFILFAFAAAPIGHVATQRSHEIYTTDCVQERINLHCLGESCGVNQKGAYEQQKKIRTLSGARFKNNHLENDWKQTPSPRAPDINVVIVSICFEI